MAPSKRRKVEQERYLCMLCDKTRISSAFPDTLPTAKCRHFINTCTACLRDWIDHDLAETKFTGTLACPECEERLQPGDVEEFARKATTKRFIELERRRIAETTPDWQWCLNPKCDSGQVYVIPMQVKKETQVKEESDVKNEALLDAKIKKEKGFEDKLVSKVKKVIKKAKDIVEGAEKKEAPVTPFVCDGCENEYCMVCLTIWHNGETCEYHSSRTKGRMVEEKQSVDLISRIAKKCPACKTPIQRIEGCNHMYCSACGQGWCYACVKKAKECICNDPNIHAHIQQDGRYMVHR